MEHHKAVLQHELIMQHLLLLLLLFSLAHCCRLPRSVALQGQQWPFRICLAQLQFLWAHGKAKLCHLSGGSIPQSPLLSIWDYCKMGSVV